MAPSLPAGQRGAFPEEGRAGFLLVNTVTSIPNGSLGDCNRFTKSAAQLPDPDFVLSTPACFAIHLSRARPFLTENKRGSGNLGPSIRMRARYRNANHGPVT